MKKGIFLSLLVFCALLIFCGCENKTTAEFFAMDTYCNVTVYGGDAKICEDAVNKTENLLEDKDTLFAVDGLTFDLQNELFETVKLSFEISKITDGLFDISIAPLSKLWNVSERLVPPTEEEIKKAKSLVGYEKISLGENSVTFFDYGMGIDVGAVGKGLAASKSLSALKENGVKEAIINLGGSVSVLGNKNKNGYNIGIKDPETDGVLGYVNVSDTSVVTSGSYQRYFEYNGEKYHHIIDPETGYPCKSGLLSATVICENPIAADALSTAFFLSGTKNAEKLFENCQQYGLTGVILITEDKNIKLIGNAKEIFSLTGEGYSIEN